MTDQSAVDTASLTVEGEVVRGAGPGRNPVLAGIGAVMVAGLIATAVSDVTGDAASILGRDDRPETVAAETSAEAENPGRYGLYQQSDPSFEFEDGTRPWVDDWFAAPPLPVDRPESPFDPAVAFANRQGSIVAYMNSGVSGVLRTRTGEGQEISAIPVDGGFELRSLSSTGSQAALWRFGAGQSEIVVVDTILGEVEGVWSYEGTVVPEAFTNAGVGLFVSSFDDSSIDDLSIDELSSSGTTVVTRLHLLDLRSGELEPVSGSSSEQPVGAPNAVAGRKMWGPDRSRLYTLYAGGIHVLDLEDESAFRLELPAELAQSEAESVALTVSDDGEVVVLAAAAGQVATWQTGNGDTPSVEALPPDALERLATPGAATAGPVHVAAADDYLLVVAGSSAHWLAADDFDVVGEAIELTGSVVGLTSGRQPLVWFGSGRQPLKLNPPS